MISLIIVIVFNKNKREESSVSLSDLCPCSQISKTDHFKDDGNCPQNSKLLVPRITHKQQ
jgi:hypothetical protein